MDKKPASVGRAPRQSNFELLRITAMMLVLIVHADYWSLGVPRFDMAASHGANVFVRVLFEMLSVVCVNVFVMISGWFGIKASVRGYANFAFQCLYFMLGIYLVMLFSGQTQFCLREMARCLFGSWFIQAYTVLYIISPVLNAYVRAASRRQLCITTGLLLAFQALFDLDGISRFVLAGYTPLSFVSLYLLARMLRLYGGSSARYGLSVYFLSVGLNVGLAYAAGLSGAGWLPSPVSYATPRVVAGAAGLVLAFSRLRLRPSGFVNMVAKSSFAVYLLHQHLLVGGAYFAPCMKTLYRHYDGIACLLLMGLACAGWFAAAVVLDRPRIWLWRLLCAIIPRLRRAVASRPF